MEHRLWHASYPTGMATDIALPADETLVTLLARAVRTHGDATAATCLGESLSFAQLGVLSDGLAGHLQSLDLAKGDRVALMMPNCLAYLVTLAGVLKAGMVAVTVNPQYTAREVEHQLRDAGARCVVVSENLADALQAGMTDCDVQHILLAPLADLRASTDATGVVAGNEALASGPFGVSRLSLAHAIAWGAKAGLAPVTVRPTNPAFLQYTGGTTGVSKGAVLTHASFGASLAQIRLWIEQAGPMQGKSMVTPLPLYHVYPLAMAFFALDAGAENRLVQNPRDVPKFIEELQRAPFEILIGVNTLFNALVASPELSAVDFSRTRLVAGAGASIQSAVAQRWVAAGAPAITEAYGLTETSPSVTFNPPGRNGTIGRAVPSTDVLIVDDSDRPVAIGERGELLIKGPQVFAGYWNRPDETRRAFTADGWFRTGDVVTMDAEGYMYVVDRKKDMILVSGFNVYPNEIEGVVAMMAEVVECACIGVPDERSGEVPHLFVVSRQPELSADAIRAHCRGNLAAYKVPKHVSFVPALPKSTVGKILRKELRQPAATAAAAA
ncbi:AMP-binding protein [Variovorax boronicumulans]|uniref:AMP-binding protein n=1 Tax=Variovorax boronicumulans TaxID=436515 RepID=UPI001C586135